MITTPQHTEERMADLSYVLLYARDLERHNSVQAPQAADLFKAGRMAELAIRVAEHIDRKFKENAR